MSVVGTWRFKIVCAQESTVHSEDPRYRDPPATITLISYISHNFSTFLKCFNHSKSVMIILSSCRNYYFLAFGNPVPAALILHEHHHLPVKQWGPFNNRLCACPIPCEKYEVLKVEATAVCYKSINVCCKYRYSVIFCPSQLLLAEKCCCQSHVVLRNVRAKATVHSCHSLCLCWGIAEEEQQPEQKGEKTQRSSLNFLQQNRSKPIPTRKSDLFLLLLAKKNSKALTFTLQIVSLH